MAVTNVAVSKCCADHGLEADTPPCTLFETMAQGAMYYDGEGRITAANPAAIELLGRSLEELRGRSFNELGWEVRGEDGNHLAAHELPSAYALRTGREKSGCTMQVYNQRDQAYRWLIVHARPQRRPGEARPHQVITTFTDITAIRTAEEALRGKEERFGALLQHAHDVTLIISEEGRFVYSSPSAGRVLGYQPEELLGRYMTEISNFRVAELHAMRQELLAHPEEAISHICSVVHRDGRPRLLLANVRNLLHDSAINGFIVNIQDISAWHEAEMRLRAVHDRLAAVVDTSPLATIVVDAAYNVQIWNRAAERIFGWTAEEIIGQPYPLRAPTGVPDPTQIFQAGFHGQTAQGLELQRLAKDGRTIDIKLWNAELRDSTGAVGGLLGIIADISEQKVLEESFRQAQKMEAVGRLAGGIAHDFNNILTALSGHAALVLEQMMPNDPLREDITEISRSVERASRLTRQLLTFSRKRVAQQSVIDLIELVTDMEKMLTRVVGEDVGLIVNVLDQDIFVNADPSQLEQIIMNLVVNARDAMPDGGELRITLSAVPMTENASAPALAHLEICDTGTGMPADVQAKIFEPFFTTKPQGKGTGLGLPTVYGIVHQAGGAIEVQSVVGEGTTFRILLPLAAAPTQGCEPVMEPRVARHKGTIMLVEDDSALRRLAERILGRAGYTVLAAAGGNEAVEIAQRGEHIDLLITDMIMPDVGGNEVGLHLRNRLPDVGVLFMSGYTEDIIGEQAVLCEAIHFLEKPFTPTQLLAKVADVLSPQLAKVG